MNAFEIIVITAKDSYGNDDTHAYTINAPQDWAEAHPSRVFDHDSERWEVVIDAIATRWDVYTETAEPIWIDAIEAEGLRITGRTIDGWTVER